MLFFQFLQAPSQRDSHFQILMIQLIGIARFEIFERCFHLLDSLDYVMRLLSQLALLTSGHQHMQKMIDRALLTQLQDGVGYVASLTTP